MSKPFITVEANKIIKAFITKVNKPKVRIFIGNVNKIKIGFKVTLMMPKNNASHNAGQKPPIVAPGIK